MYDYTQQPPRRLEIADQNKKPEQKNVQVSVGAMRTVAYLPTRNSGPKKQIQEQHVSVSMNAMGTLAVEKQWINKKPQQKDVPVTVGAMLTSSPSARNS